MITEFIKVVPAEGYRVLDDQTLIQVPKEGQRVRRSAYWDRLENEGAVKITAEKPADAKPAEKGADK